MSKLIRMDVGRFRSKPQRTQQGFLLAPANLTRTGVLVYATPDGQQVREYRPPDEVFKADSLATMQFAPITNRHPSELVSPQNVRSLQRGFVTAARKDDRFIAGDLIFQDQEMIAGVESRDIAEISAGYQCSIDETPGTSPEGERYDRIQRNIVYNHVAAGPANWGRAGNDVRIRLDGIGSELLPLIGIECLRLDQGLAPERDMSREELSELREKRSQRFKIEILKQGSNLTFPSGYPTDLDDYADPVNLKYPIAPAGRARNARARFKQAAAEYGDRQSKAVIHERIVRRLLEIGAKPSIDDSDPLDRLLPDSLKEKATSRRGDSRRTKGKTMDVELITVRIDDLDFEVPKSAHSAILKALGSRDEQIKDLTSRIDGLQGKFDALTKEHADATKRFDAATAPEAIQSAVNARLALVSSATKILGSETKFDGMSDRDIKVAVISKRDDSFKADNLSDEYINGRFDMVISSPEPDQRNDGSNGSRFDVANALNQQQRGNQNQSQSNESRIDSADAARLKAHVDVSEAWRKPLREVSQR